MEEFYVIKIVNKKVYLGASDNSNSFIWTKKREAIWFDDQEKAERFANDYFKILIIGKLFHYGLTLIRWKK